MSSLIRRAAWVDPKYPVTGPAVNLANIDSIVIHYPGVDPGALNLDNPVQVLRNTHLFYLGKGYSIGYNFATFPSGRYELRGFDIKNAANVNHNDHTLSINVMVNGADPAPPIQVQYTRDMVEDIWAHLGREVPLIAHGDLPGAATACPGVGVRSQFAQFIPAAVAPPVVNPPTALDPEERMTQLYRKTNKAAVWLGDRRFRTHVNREGDLSALEAEYGPVVPLDPSADLGAHVGRIVVGNDPGDI